MLPTTHLLFSLTVFIDGLFQIGAGLAQFFRDEVVFPANGGEQPDGNHSKTNHSQPQADFSNSRHAKSPKADPA